MGCLVRKPRKWLVRPGPFNQICHRRDAVIPRATLTITILRAGHHAEENRAIVVRNNDGFSDQYGLATGDLGHKNK